MPRVKERAEKAVMKLIAYYDVLYAAGCDGFLLNLNGRVPDEGSLVEGAIAFANGKHVVAYKSDSRSLIHGHDNPLVSILSDFKIVDSIDEIPKEFRRLEKQKPSTMEKIMRESDEIFTKEKYTARQFANLALNCFMD